MALVMAFIVFSPNYLDFSQFMKLNQSNSALNLATYKHKNNVALQTLV